MPYLPVALVEEAVEHHVASISLHPEWAERTQQQLTAALDHHHATIREMNRAVTEQLRTLAAQEERVIDLLADGDIPRDAAKQRLRTIENTRTRLEDEKRDTDQRLAIGHDVLTTCLDLMTDIGTLYTHVPDTVRGLLCHALFEAIHLDDTTTKTTTVTTSTLNEPFATLHDALTGTRTPPHDHETTHDAPNPPQALTTRTGTPTGAPDTQRTPGVATEGSSKRRLAEVAGFEPAMGLSPKPA